MAETRKTLLHNNKNNAHKTLTDLYEKDLIVDISDNAIIKVSGDNAKNFLQGQLTCDLNQITQEHSSLAASCTNKGRVVSLFRILKNGDDYLLLLPNSYSKALLEHLSRYAPLSRVDVSVYTHFTVHYGLSGQHAGNRFSENTAIPGELNQVSISNDCIIIKIPGPVLRYEILAPSKKSLLNILPIEQLHKQEPNVWSAFDYLISLPSIEEETTAAYTPHMLNLIQHNAVSFAKGCYIGQEVIARTEHLGKAKRCLLPTILPGGVAEFNVGDEILDHTEKKIGEVLNSVSIKNNQLILIIIDKAASTSKFFLRGHELHEVTL